MKKITIMKMMNTVVATLLCTVMSTSAFSSEYAATNQNQSGDQSAAINELLSSGSASAATATSNAAAPAATSAAPMTQSAAVAPTTTSAAVAPTTNTAAVASSELGDTTDSQAAFASMTKNIMPLSDDQIRTLRKLFDNSKRAAAESPTTPAKPTSSSIMVDLSPGATPPVIRLQAGFITAVQFLDSTGQAWPISAADLGDPDHFNMQWDQSGNPSTLLIQAGNGYQSGNLAVMLKGKSTPLMITLLPGQSSVDYRVDLRIPGLGPNASPEMSSMPDTESPDLLNVLDGVPPQGAKALKVSDSKSQAWSINGKLFLRTSLTLLSPAWLSTMSSPDGMHAYELVKSPVLLVSNRGSIQKISIQGL